LIRAGALADVYGRRRIFVIGLLGFGATSILCGIAPTLEFLVLARILQGAAGALLVPGSLAIITATFDGASRARAFGLWASATSTLTLLGPIVGGLIVDKLSWRLAFLLNIPLVAIAVWASIRHVAESRDPEADHRFDWIGAIVGAGAIGGLAFGAIVGLPRGILLAVLSARIGGLSGRFGPRIFLVAGPLVMAAALLWYARIPASSAPWLADLGRPETLIPPVDVLIDVLPAVILFGIGISMVVAPLTSTLMGSIPANHSGLGSAINNALSRVGQPLLGALIFVAITASFYSSLASRVPGLDPADPAVRAAIVPLNPPKAGVPADEAAAAKEASVDAFHLAALTSMGLLIAGAAASGIGLRSERTVGRPE